MIQRVLSHYHLPLLTSVGLLIFVTVFVGALLWVFRKNSRKIYAGIAQLPFEDLQAIPRSETLFEKAGNK